MIFILESTSVRGRSVRRIHAIIRQYRAKKILSFAKRLCMYLLSDGLQVLIFLTPILLIQAVPIRYLIYL